MYRFTGPSVGCPRANCLYQSSVFQIRALRAETYSSIEVLLRCTRSGQVWLHIHSRSLASVHFAWDCLLLSEAVLPGRWGDWSIGSRVHRPVLLPWEAVAFRFALLTLQGEPLLQWRSRCGQIAYKEPVAGFPVFASNCALWPF